MLVCMPLMIAAGCASLPDHPELPPQASMPPGSDAPLDLTLSEAESQHAGEAGFRLVVEGMEAFVIRAQSANMAARSIDVQSYIWHADATGQYLARVLNCEQGVLVEDAVLAAQLGEIFRLQSAANRAWKVTLDTGELRWSDGGEILDSEPRASAWRKFQAWFARAFHLDAQL
jgi:phosphatidylserine/phosphatidylglycerophosphate/cardiolipin synthase-like enzyme